MAEAVAREPEEKISAAKRRMIFPPAGCGGKKETHEKLETLK